jgi:glutaryl-CoA dehydrogenase
VPSEFVLDSVRLPGSAVLPEARGLRGTLFAFHLGRIKDDRGLRPEQVGYGKLNNTRTALEICHTARTVLGANGISLEYPVIRHANNLESVLTG